MARPYVYRCEHKITKKFYVGYRKANIFSAILDFGIHYFTSCPEVSNNFSDYSFEILGEFNSADTAFEIEQKLIYDARNNPLLINKNWKISRIKIDIENRLESFKHCIPRTDKISGDTRLARKKSKRKVRKIHIPTERERLGPSYQDLKDKKKRRKENKAKSLARKALLESKIE